MLENTLKWREQQGVDRLKWDDVKDEAVTGKTYRLHARDKMGRPVLGLRPGRENTRGHANQIRFLIYNMETITRSVKAKWTAPPRGSGSDLSPEQLTLYLDFTVRICVGFACVLLGRKGAPERVSPLWPQFCGGLTVRSANPPPSPAPAGVVPAHGARPQDGSRDAHDPPGPLPRAPRLRSVPQPAEDVLGVLRGAFFSVHSVSFRLSCLASCASL